MSEKVEHTELPWRVVECGDESDRWWVALPFHISVQDYLLHDIQDELIASFDNKGAAEYFVRAVNSYPALLAERDRLREALENLWDAAKEVHELGASVGGQWATLSLALEQSSPLLKDSNQ